MKNILIMGIGRAGKTTLSRNIKDKINGYNLIHSDSLKWAMIRAKGEEKYYRANVDKQKELAALFNATSIPLFVFIPMKGDPQLFRGAADKATYKKAIDEFLLK